MRNARSGEVERGASRRRSFGRRRRRALRSLLALACLLVASRGGAARAQPLDHRVRADLGVGHLLSDPHRDRFGLGGGLGGGYELRLHRYVGLDARLGAFLFMASEAGGTFGSYYAPSIGARLHVLPDLEGVDPFVAARLALAITGGEVRPGLEVDAGVEFELMDRLAVGPFLRFVQVIQPDGDNLGPADGIYLAVGAVASYQLGGEPGPRVDSDGDGLFDDDDECPSEPEDADGHDDGDGCPDVDDDSDGIADVADACREQPEDFDGFQDEDGCPEDDNDGDGVPDASDECRDEPEDRDGDRDEDGCPEEAPDTDGDGVRDDVDRCVAEPEDPDGYEDEDGCPELDNDQDGVPDASDECPLAPGPASQNGCPRSVRVEEGRIRILQRIEFETNRATLRPGAGEILEDVRATLAANAQIRRVRIEGHTDDRGDDQRNLELSEARAQAVRAWLVEHGIEAGRLEAVGMGETRPLEGNDSRSGRRANRRVEFNIVDPAPGER